jgi:RHS repeat-associated protein
VQATVNGVTTQFVGSHVEWQSSTTDMVRYYYAGSVRVAMRTGDDGLVWLVGDHLGSTSIAVTDASGATERQGYKAWGETRFGSLPTKYQYTGLRNEPELGMYYYGARWYDTYLNRWAQPDSIIPDNYNPLDWDRYSYVQNNPLKYTDPSGHQICRDDYCGKDDRDADSLAESLFENEDWWRFKKVFGFRFTGVWTPEMKLAAYQAIFFVAMALATIAPGFTPEGIFKRIFGDLNLEYGDCPNCAGAFGYTHGASHIEFGGMYGNLTQDTRLIVHEFGHAFDHAVADARPGDGNVWAEGARADLTGHMGLCNNSADCLGRNGYTDDGGGNWGFAGGKGTWQFGLNDTPGEVFADMFLGWVFNTWGPDIPLSNRGTIRQGYMNGQMNYYLTTYFN